MHCIYACALGSWSVLSPATQCHVALIFLFRYGNKNAIVIISTSEEEGRAKKVKLL